MIQRIQSIYLLFASLAALMIIIPLEKFPLVKFYGENFAMHFQGVAIKNLVPGEANPFSTYFLWPFVCLVIIIVIIGISSIFLYKNRKKQMLAIKINILLSLLLLGGFFFYYIPVIEKTLKTIANYQFNSFLPALVLLFLVLAYRAVKKDDQLIKSIDRIR